MKNILTINYTKFAFSTAAKASKAFELLSEAIQVDDLVHADESGLFIETNGEHELGLSCVNYKLATPEQVEKAHENHEEWRKKHNDRF